MPSTITGIVDSFRYFPGWARVAEVVVDGQTFYQRLGRDRVARVKPGTIVRVAYDQAKIYGSDGVMDHLTLARVGRMPRVYNEIISLNLMPPVPEAALSKN